MLPLELRPEETGVPSVKALATTSRLSWRASGRFGANVLRQYPGFVLIAVLLVVGTTTTPNLMTLATWQGLLNKVAIDFLIVIGLSFVLISGEVDLSVGSSAALGSVVWVELANRAGPVAAFATAAAVGLVAGLLNGVIVTRLGINSIIATIATMIGYSGAVLVVSNGNDVSGTQLNLAISSQSPLAGLSFLSPVSLFAIACVIVGQLLLTWVRWGRRLYLVGGTKDRGELSGINGRKDRTIAFVACGLLAVVAGALVGMTLGAGIPSYGSATPLNDIAAAVIGGTSLLGGQGSVLKSASGVLAIGLLVSILDLHSVSSVAQGIAVGMILVAVVVADARWRQQISSMTTRRKRGGSSEGLGHVPTNQ